MSRETILVVDSDARSRRVLEVSFKKEGYRVATAESASEAGAYLDSRVPDVIVSEVDLPDGNGLSFLAELKSRPKLRDMPFLVLTDEDSLSATVEGLEVGADEYLTRPIFIKEVLTRVQTLLDRETTHLLTEEQAEEFTGRLSEYTLIDLLQHVDDEGSSGLIRLERGEYGGEVLVRHGKPVDAVCGKLEGEAAIYRMMKWDEGAFTVVYGSEVDAADHVDKTADELLVEGLDRLEAWHDRLDPLPDLNSVYEIDYDRLADFEEGAPGEVGRIVRLFDGYRTLEDVVEDSPVDDLTTLEALDRIFRAGLLNEVDPRGERGRSDFELESLSEWLHDADGTSEDRDEFLRGSREATSPGLPTLESSDEAERGDRQLTAPQREVDPRGSGQELDRESPVDAGDQVEIEGMREEERRRRREEARRLAELRSRSDDDRDEETASGRLERDPASTSDRPSARQTPRSDRVHEVESDDGGVPVSFEPVEDEDEEELFDLKAEQSLREKASEAAGASQDVGSADGETEDDRGDRAGHEMQGAAADPEQRTRARTIDSGEREDLRTEAGAEVSDSERGERISPVEGSDLEGGGEVDIDRVTENATLVRSEYELAPPEDEEASAGEETEAERGLTWEDEPEAERAPGSRLTSASVSDEETASEASDAREADEGERSASRPERKTTDVARPRPGAGRLEESTETETGAEPEPDEPPSSSPQPQLDERFGDDSEPGESDGREDVATDASPASRADDEPAGEESGEATADFFAEETSEDDELPDDLHEERFFESGGREQYDFEGDYERRDARTWWIGGATVLVLASLVWVFDPFGIVPASMTGTDEASSDEGSSASDESDRIEPPAFDREQAVATIEAYGDGVRGRAQRFAMVLAGKDPYIVGAADSRSGGESSDSDSSPQENQPSASDSPSSGGSGTDEASGGGAGSTRAGGARPPSDQESAPGEGGSDVSGRVEAIKTLVRSGDYSTAYDKLQTLRADAPESSSVADLYPRVGSGFQRDGDMAEAEKVYREYLENYPSGQWAGQIRSILEREFE